MNETPRKVTLWLAWYVTNTEVDEPLRPLRLKMLYATSEAEARTDMQQWLEQRGQTLKALECLEPSPYGFQFQFRQEYPGQITQQQKQLADSHQAVPAEDREDHCANSVTPVEDKAGQR